MDCFSNILSEAKQIDIFDSVYSNIEETTEVLVSGMFDQPVELKVYPSLEKQKGSMDCGVYCTAVCASHLPNASMNFSQSLNAQNLFHVLRSFMLHLIHMYLKPLSLYCAYDLRVHDIPTKFVT